MSPPPTREDRFRTLYEELRPQLLRFARRRAGSGTAEDVVADAFLVIWRRLDETPSPPEDARAWAFGITRNVLLNQQRGSRRHLAVGVRLADQGESSGEASQAAFEEVVNRVDLARAWRRLRASHQEALSLVVFDGLDAPRAATVIGISPVAFRLRLSRARRALRLQLDHQPPVTARTPAGAIARSTP